jgi:hypothetical protein
VVHAKVIYQEHVREIVGCEGVTSQRGQAVDSQGRASERTANTWNSTDGGVRYEGVPSQWAREKLSMEAIKRICTGESRHQAMGTLTHSELRRVAVVRNRMRELASVIITCYKFSVFNKFNYQPKPNA